MGIERTQSYVVGFLFSRNKEKILLIKKNKPKWQEGFLNGVGGKVEKEESPLEAMIREFEEETGIKIDFWEEYLIIHSKSFKLYCFKAFSNLIYQTNSITDEPLHMMSLSNTRLEHAPLIPNLRWMIPLALDELVESAEVVNNSDNYDMAKYAMVKN
ncbi:MAG: NUDIX domain-containing protein [Novosphingobium sp.]|nr:NUDIX domain-containing protein [Novosphingobium sp.]